MPIVPLPQFEADLEEARREAEAYARLSVPKTLVVRFGVMRFIGEFPYGGDVKPGCGTKLVVRTHRGTELGEMLTSTCPNAGCSKSVSRQEMLQYIENSGGPDYPFFTEGRVLRIAEVADLNEQSRLDSLRPALVKSARRHAEALGLKMRIVEAEPILGGERLTFYFTAEERVDFRELLQRLSAEHRTRIELRQVGARDEARLIADYEKCGQHCCCRQFLKVLKPVSIRSAKTQKATLDPLKISGRCGRLMCCLRYEDETYETLAKRLPKVKKRVGTPHGVGIVIDRQILTQLVLVKLEQDGREVAVPVEEITPPDAPAAEIDPLRGLKPEQIRAGDGPAPRPSRARASGSTISANAGRPRDAAPPADRGTPTGAPGPSRPDERPREHEGRRRRRKKKRRKGGGPFGGGPAFGGG